MLSIRRIERLVVHGTLATLMSAITPPCHAQILYTSQLRRIEASGGGPFTVVKFTESLDPWSESGEVFIPNPTPDPPSYAFASQSSRLEPFGVFASGRVDGIDNGSSGGGGGAAGKAEIFLTFSIAEPTPAVARLWGPQSSPSGSAIRRNIIQLSGATTGTLIDLSVQNIGIVPFTFNVPLIPDIYTLYFKSEDGWHGFLGQSWTEYNFHFIVPAPAGAAPLLGALSVMARRRRT